ncbi:hypothetical protein KHA93_11610 [Bacillus sp. FJAT-49732]|uniref:Uncharacterized protein n=1 Tax=Lederbergia citrisecunda TaxID=2833583 RepID=A0A942TP38_9BACI|nr:hypothetical protein [Lederbergia citrisecunda]MBS4200277.1 hypothetical protein [Lederbergia citrisecunda]
MDNPAIRSRFSFANFLFIVVVIFSYVALWSSTVFSRYRNAELYSTFQVSFEEVVSNTNVLATQISLIVVFAGIYLIIITNLKSIFNNKRNIFYVVMITLIPYLLLKSDDPLSYLTSLSNGSVQLGPYTVVGIALFFYAYNPRNWHSIEKAIRILTILSILTAFYGLAQYYAFFSQLGMTSRVVALKWLWTSTICLQFTLIYWLYWGSKKTKKKKSAFMTVTLLILFQYLLALLTEMRLVLVITTIGILLYLYKTGKIKRVFMVGITLIAIAAWLVVYLLSKSGFLLPPTNLINNAINGFLIRFSADTRSADLKEFIDFVIGDFFSFFPVGYGYSQSVDFIVDSGILNTLFMTGPIMLLMAYMLLIRPALHLRKFKLSPEEAWIWVIAVMWILRFFTSSTMVFNTEFLIFIIVAGRSAWILDDKIKRDKYNKINAVQSEQTAT